MSEWWPPAGVLLAAVVLTYFFCVRPMRRGHAASTATARPNTPADLDRALDHARTELTRLRAQNHQNARAHPDAAPPTRNRVLEEDHR